MNKRKLRRVAIVALVLVLLCNTLGVQAETGAPAVTVSSYEAKGVDVKLEITGDSYNISISAPEGQESQIQPVNEVSTVNASESTTEPQRSPNWIEYITVILLAVLVGLEIKDKLHKEK